MSKIKATVYICSPYRADTKEQLKKHVEYAKGLSRDFVLKGFSVITPHLYYTNFLNDNDELQREMGLSSARELILKCDFIVAGVKYGISDGMAAEMAFAKQHNIDVYLMKTKQHIKDFQDKFIPNEDICSTCVHKQGDIYLENCGVCSRFYADQYKNIKEQ